MSPKLNRFSVLSQDREAEARFGSTPVPGKIGAALGEARPVGRAMAGGFGGAAAGPPADYRQLFVGNVSQTKSSSPA
jgi:hypothetical protein